MPVKLVGASGKLRTEDFDKINKTSQIRWKFEFPEVASPGAKLKKVWENFKLWLLTNEHQTVKDFEEMSDSEFKTSFDGELCRCEREEGEYEF